MTVSFAVQKLWSFIRSHLSILAYVANSFGVLVMKSLPTPMSWSPCLLLCPEWFCLDFLLGFFWGKVLCLSPSGVNFSVRCQEGVQFLLSAHSKPVFPTPFIKQGILSPLLVFVRFVKDWMVVDMLCCLWGLFLFHWSISLFWYQYHAVFITVVL